MPTNNAAQTYRAWRGTSTAFTLIELLIVIALTGLLLTLIIGPLIQGFNLTNRARAFAEAQDATRFGIERLKRELSQASYVFDNSTTPIMMPFSNNANDARGKDYPNVYSAGIDPSVLYAELDFIPSATAGEGPANAIDPTTNKPLGGTPVILPIAPGHRYVRYFVGLHDPYTKDAAGHYAGPNYYSNSFQFTRTDNNMNAFVLWRAEYDPTDPNLIDQTAAQNNNTYAVNAAGLHDPNFFYNPNIAANGRTYAENWRAVSEPVLNAPNLDLIAWRLNQARQIVSGTPFQLLLNLTPTSVTGETATPGFLSSAPGNQGSAVPTLYATQSGLWTYPYTITVYRGSAQGRPGTARFGEIQFVVQQTPAANLSTTLSVTMNNAPVAGASNDSIDPASTTAYYWLYDASTGKLLIHTAKLTFQVDAARGRIETAFPPLVTQNGVPLYYPNGDTTQTPVPLANAVTPTTGNFGTLVPAVFRQDTYRGTVLSNDQSTTITNAGLVQTNLNSGFYYQVTSPLASFSNPGTPYPSPFSTFMGGAWQSIIISPGSERVMGPDNNFVDANNKPLLVDASGNLLLTNYFGISPLASITKPNDTTKDSTGQAVFVRSVQPNYQLETGVDSYNQPTLTFDANDTTSKDPAAGLPAAKVAGIGELRVTYLWQNNFARDAAGHPVNAFGEYIGSGNAPSATNPNTTIGIGANHAPVTAIDYRPEPDVFKVDYTTRTQINILLGARVFDSSTGQPQTAQVTNRITVGNVAQ